MSAIDVDYWPVRGLKVRLSGILPETLEDAIRAYDASWYQTDFRSLDAARRYLYMTIRDLGLEKPEKIRFHSLDEDYASRSPEDEPDTDDDDDFVVSDDTD